MQQETARLTPQKTSGIRRWVSVITAKVPPPPSPGFIGEAGGPAGHGQTSENSTVLHSPCSGLGGLRSTGGFWISRPESSSSLWRDTAQHQHTRGVDFTLWAR